MRGTRTGLTARLAAGLVPGLATVLGALAATTLAAGLATVLGSLAATTLVAGPASAHNVVVDTTPGTGSTVAEAPAEVSVTFDDVVLELGADGSSTVVQVTGEDGQEYATGCPTTTDRTVSVPVSLDDAGEYTVAWRIVSADGHPTSGEFSFTYAPADGAASQGASSAEADATGAPQAGCGAGEGEQTAAGDEPEAAGADASGTGSSDLPVALGIAGGVVVLAGAGVLVALRVSRRRD